MLAYRVFDLKSLIDFEVLDLSDPRFFIPWRLSGLLSGYLPTDTRPQARAKLGKTANKGFESASQENFCGADKILAQRANKLVARLTERERLLSFLNER